MEVLTYWYYRFTSLLRWYRAAKTPYDVHSPFLADFIAQVITDTRRYHVFDLAREVRRHWRGHPGRVKVVELGAGSRVTKAPSRKISRLVTASAIPPRYGEILTKTALWNRAEYLVELGTNVGISALYLHYADRRAQLHTVEGNPEIAALARETFALTGCSAQMYPYTGAFSDHLPAILTQIPRLDLLFVDGDHRYEPTLDYLRRCLPHARPDSVFIVADIHWSEDMEYAWAAAKTLPGVTASLDLYHFGMLFFRPGVTPGQHLALIAARWKPWRMGFF